jgi:soluble lytic murein transglycosylase
VRHLAATVIVVLGLAGAAVWVVRAQPDWYLRARYPLSYGHSIRASAQDRGLDPALVAAVVYVESRFDPDARSDVGAIGLMQLLPGTARGIAARTGGSRFVVADLRDPDLNVRYGSWYLAHLVDRYGSVDLGLAAYHSGQGRVDRWLASGSGVEPSGARAYVTKVQQVRRMYVKAYGPALGA